MPSTDATIQDNLRAADQRREALYKAGCTTYLLQDMHGHPSILCLCCGLRSWRPMDIQDLCCAACFAWHETRLPWEGTP